jgi:hypothetical protein
MRKFAIMAVAALALFAFSGMAYAQGDTALVTMNEQNGSGQIGATALVDAGNGQTAVAINITAGAAGVGQPAHIHKGTCANLDPKPAFPLTNVMNGTSETIVNASLAELASGQYAVNVHKSGPEASVYVSCGDIAAMVTAPAPAPVTAPVSAPETGTTVGMPRTGAPAFGLVAALVLLATSILGAGFTLARRRA